MLVELVALLVAQRNALAGSRLEAILLKRVCRDLLLNAAVIRVLLFEM